MRVKNYELTVAIAVEMSSLRLDIVVFGLTLIASTLLVGAEGACKEAHITKCLANFSVYEPSKYTYTREELEATCRLANEFLKCIDATGCANETQGRALINGMKNATDYICKKHKEEFLENEQCFKSKKLDLSEDYCRQKAIWEPTKSTCDKANQLISCSVKSVNSCCGKKAADLIDGFLKVVLQQNVSLIIPADCKLRSDLDVEILPLCK